MQSKWTGLSVILLLVFVVAVPLIASSQGANLWMWFTPAITPAGEAIGTLFNWVLLLCGVLFVGIHAIMIYFAIAYRAGNRDETAHTHGHLGIEVTWTIIPTIIMIVFGIYSYNVYANIVETPKDPMTVKVTAQQFAWNVKYPSTDKSSEDPISMNNQMVLPSNRSIQIQLQSKDVLHSFYVPHFRNKQDAVPGMTTVLNIQKIQETGKYDIKCAELCGVGHYRMNASLAVVSPDEFETWKEKKRNDKGKQYLKKVMSDE
ncbi:MAG: cytochrome c oxidase subunit II [bacterium]